MSKKIATFEDLDTLANLTKGTSAGYISGATNATNNQCVNRRNFDTVSSRTIAAKGNGLMFVDGSASSGYDDNRLILLDDVQYISEITAVLVSAPNIPAKGGSSYATWKLTQSYKANGDASPSIDEWNVTGSMVEAGSKGTTISNVTDVANSTITVTRKGKSITLSQMIKQDLNKMVSLSGTTSTFSYDSKVGAGGGSVYPTLNGNVGTVTFSSNATLAASSCEGYKYTRSWSATNTGLWTLDTSNGKLTASSKLTNIGNETISMIVTGSCICKVVNPSSVGGDTLSKNATATATAKQNGNYVTELTIGSHSLSYAAITAGATSASPTHNAGTLTYKFSSGSTTTTKPAADFGSLSDTHTYSIANTTNGFTAINSSTGVLTATSRGTTIGNARTSATVTCTRTCKWTPTSSYNADGAITKTNSVDATCTQNGNYVTKVEAKASGNVAHVKYADISAGGTTSTPQGTGAGLYTFSSGSTKTDSSTSPSFGGSASYTRTYVEKANSDASNAFTVNTTNGTVTTSHRGTTPGAARSVTVTSTLVINYTHNAGMSAPNASVSGECTDDVVVTQLENKITSYGIWTTPTITVNPNSFAAAGGTAAITISGDSTRTNTWSSDSYSTDTATKSIKSVSFGTVSNDYKTLTVGVNTTGTNRTGNVNIDWSFGGSVVQSVQSNSYSQVGQSDCTMTLTGSTEVYHDTATIIGNASVAGTIYWGETPTSMTNHIDVSANKDTTITSNTLLGTKTIYAYFKPTDKNYKTLGSENSYYTSASAKVEKASDANISITTHNTTYDGSAKTVVTCDSKHGVSTWTLGYTKLKNATANRGVIWNEINTNLSLTNAGTYYIWRKWTADDNHSNSNDGEKIDATVTIYNAEFTVIADDQDYIYDGSAKGEAITVSNLKGNQTATIKYGTTSGTYNTTTVPKITNVKDSKMIYWQVTAPNHTTQSGSYLLTVNKATPAAPILNAGNKETYDGSLVFATAANASNNPAGMIHYYNAENDDVIHTLSVTAGSTTPINLDKVGRKQVGTTTIWAFFIPSDTVNYSKSNRVSTTVTVENKATPTMTLTGVSKTYDGNTYYVSGKASIPGKIYYGTTSATSGMTSSAMVSANTATNIVGRKDYGTTTVYAYFVPNDTINYNSLGSSSNEHTRASVTISKATPTLTVSLNTPLTYDGSAKTIATMSNFSGDNYKFGFKLSGSTSIPTFNSEQNTVLSATNAGTYEVWVRCDGSTNYNAVAPYKAGTVVINQREVTITAPTAATNLIYNETIQEIFEEGSCTPGGEMYYTTTYKEGEEFSTSTWKTSLSLADKTGDNARTYTLHYYCYVKDEKNNIGEGINTIKSVSATIKQKPTTAPILTAGYLDTFDKSKTVYATAANASKNPPGKIYYGETPKATTYSITVTASTTAYQLTNMGQHNVGKTTIYAFFRPSDTDNYIESTGVSTEVEVKKKAEGFLTATIKSEFTYDGSAHTIATNKESSGSYYFGNSSSTTIDPTSWGLRSRALKCTDAGTYYVWGKCDASTNYNAVDAKYLGTAIIRQRIVTITAPTATNRIYSGSAQTIFTAGDCGSGGEMYYSLSGGTFSISDSNWSTTLPYTQKTAIGKYTLYYYCHVSDTSNNTGAGINTIKSVSATIDRVIEDYIYKVTCNTVESVDKWTTTLNLNNLIMPTHWIGQEIYFRVYDKNKVLIPRPKNEPSQYSFRITQDFTTGNSKDIEIIRGAQASLCGEKYGLVEPRYIKIEQKEGTNLPENYVPFDETRYIDVDYIY